MSVFYVSKDGVSAARPEPVGKGRVLEMLREGELGAEAMVMAPGAEDWFPARLLLEEAEEEKRAAAAAAARELARAQAMERSKGTGAMRVVAILLGTAGLALGLGGCGQAAALSVAADEESRESMADLAVLAGYYELPPVRVLALLREQGAERGAGLPGSRRMIERLSELEAAGTLERTGERAIREAVERERRIAAMRVSAMRERGQRWTGVGVVGWCLVALSMALSWSALKKARG